MVKRKISKDMLFGGDFAVEIGNERWRRILGVYGNGRIGDWIGLEEEEWVEEWRFDVFLGMGWTGMRLGRGGWMDLEMMGWMGLELFGLMGLQWELIGWVSLELMGGDGGTSIFGSNGRSGEILDYRGFGKYFLMEGLEFFSIF